MKTDFVNYEILDNKSRAGRLPSFNKTVFFIDTTQNVNLANSFSTIEARLQTEFEKENFTLLDSNQINIDDKIDDRITYLFPVLNESKLQRIENHFSDLFTNFNSSQYLLDYVEYKGEIKTGLLIIDVLRSEILVVECENSNDLEKFTNSYISNYQKPGAYGDFLPMSTPEIDNIEIDLESKQAIDNILSGIDTIKQNGDLVKILPYIEKYIQSCTKNYLNAISYLIIDKDYNVNLTGYDITITLSPLSMSVYLLFLNHPNGIVAKQIHLYKDELLANYNKISKRDDYDQAVKSIDDIINPDKNALYVHLSRIKSAFIKKMHKDLAINYYIIGERNKPKYISVDRKIVKVLNDFGA